MDNTYQLVFAPELGIDPAEFVAEWNNTSECLDIAEAKLEIPVSSNKSSFQGDFSISEITLAAVILALTIHLVAGEIHEAEFYKKLKRLVYDNLDKLLKRNPPQSKQLVITPEVVDIEILTQEDGSKLVLLTLRLPPSE